MENTARNTIFGFLRCDGSLLFRMERKYRLRVNADFRRTRQKGKSWVNHLVVLCALPNDLEHSRFGFAASKRIGKAVVRNRVRRRMREAVRLRRASIVGGWDMVFIARRPIARANYAKIAYAIDALLDRANLTVSWRQPSDLAQLTEQGGQRRRD